MIHNLRQSDHTKTIRPSSKDANWSAMDRSLSHQAWPKPSFKAQWKGQGGQKKRWEDNITEWTGLEFAKSQTAVENREKWRKLVVKSFVVPQWPFWLRDRWRWRIRILNNYFVYECTWYCTSVCMCVCVCMCVHVCVPLCVRVCSSVCVCVCFAT